MERLMTCIESPSSHSRGVWFFWWKTRQALFARLVVSALPSTAIGGGRHHGQRPGSWWPPVGWPGTRTAALTISHAGGAAPPYYIDFLLGSVLTIATGHVLHGKPMSSECVALWDSQPQRSSTIKRRAWSSPSGH